MSCFRERAMFSMPISTAMSMSSCIDLVLSSVRLSGFSDGTCGSRRLRRLRLRRLRPPPWFSPSSLADVVSVLLDLACSCGCSAAASSSFEASARFSLSVFVDLSSVAEASDGSASGVTSTAALADESIMLVSSSCTRFYLWLLGSSVWFVHYWRGRDFFK